MCADLWISLQQHQTAVNKCTSTPHFSRKKIHLGRAWRRGWVFSHAMTALMSLSLFYHCLWQVLGAFFTLYTATIRVRPSGRPSHKEWLYSGRHYNLLLSSTTHFIFYLFRVGVFFFHTRVASNSLVMCCSLLCWVITAHIYELWLVAMYSREDKNRLIKISIILLLYEKAWKIVDVKLWTLLLLCGTPYSHTQAF